MANGFGLSLGAKMIADASAALSIVARRVRGKVRHLDMNHLWIQQGVVGRTAKFEKVAGAANPTDFVTKGLPSGTLRDTLE